MAQITPVNKPPAQGNGQPRQHAAASAGPGDREPEQKEDPAKKRKKVLLTPPRDSGVTYRPDGAHPNPKDSLKKHLDVDV